MNKFTKQMQAWAGNFGQDYTDRNALSLQEVERLYKERLGITRTEMNSRFVGDLNRDITVLEVGSNIGNQLLLLQNIGFKNLYDIELQPYAVELSKNRTKGINIIQGSAFDIPFKDGYFDLVFTSGLLIHIAPYDIANVLDEIYRCTKKYIWCFEYYSDVYTQIDYRGHAELLWKTDFAKLFLNRFRNMTLVKEEHFKYLNNDNVDTMLLLRKIRE
ncbi:MAG: methyltransferase domain-containing protein [Dehalococcoidales bacterium]|nr:methyltransferase domain-containing protein [Dehalococcoidales bacterium]